MTTRDRTRRGAILLLACVLVGCARGEDGATSSTASEPAVTPSVEPEPTSTTVTGTSPEPGTTAPDELEPGELTVDPLDPWLDAEGMLGVDGALALFAATFAPLPGVEPAARPAADADSLVLSTLTPVLAELTPGQREVIEEVLAGPGIPLDDILSASNAGEARRVSGERADRAAPILAEARDHFATRLGRDLGGILITVVELPMIGPGGVRNFGDIANAAAATPLYDPDTLVYDECRIRLNTDAVYNEATFRSQVAHELFHCFQFAVTDAAPVWVKEGAAAYAGEELAGGSAQSSSWWARWIDQPHRPITRRSYDAIGLFSLVAALGGDAYRVSDELLRTPALSTLTDAVPGLTDVWGTHYATEPAWGADYGMRGPGAPTTRALRFRLRFTVDGPPSPFDYPPRPPGEGAQAYEFDAPGDVLRIAGNGAAGGARFADGTEVRFGAATTDVCLRPDGCECPSGSPGPALSVSSPRGFVGLGPSATPPALSAMSLEAWCDETTPPTTAPAPEPSACEIGTWVSTEITLPAVPGTATTFAGGDGVVVVLGPDGSFSADYTGMNPAVGQAAIQDGPGVSVEVRFDGRLDGTWSVGPDGRFVVNGDASGVRVVATAAVAGIEQTVIDDSLAALVAASPGPVLTVSECDGDLMRISNVYPGGSQTLTLARTG